MAAGQTEQGETTLQRGLSRYWASDTAVMFTMAALVGIGAGLER